jgi:hypothetical protein
MKWLKKFNEELSPGKYRRAGQSLGYYGQIKRSSELIDYADELEFGLYNMITSEGLDRTQKSFNLVFTKPCLTAIYLGNKYDESKNVLNKKNDYSDKIINSLVKNWISGTDTLSIIFEFGFQPTKKTILDKENQYLEKLLKFPKRSDGTSTIANSFPCFSLYLELSEWYDGLEEWDSESKWQAEQEGHEFVPTSVDTFFRWTHNREVRLIKPNFRNFTIFSDRKSATKFKNWLLTEFDEQIIGTIMEILGIVGGQSKDIEDIKNKFKNLKIHGLYNETPPNQNFDGLSL